jgi:hypothetical protein
MARKRQTTQTAPAQKPPVEISEDEQWRLIQESGVLKKISDTPKPEEAVGNGEPLPLAEEIFNAVVLIMPFTFFLVMMDM